MKLKRRDLVKWIAIRLGNKSEEVIDQLVQEIFKGLADILINGNNIWIEDFATLEVKLMRPRRAYNPRERKPILVRARKKLVIHPKGDLASGLGIKLPNVGVKKKVKVVDMEEVIAIVEEPEEVLSNPESEGNTE